MKIYRVPPSPKRFAITELLAKEDATGARILASEPSRRLRLDIDVGTYALDVCFTMSPTMTPLQITNAWGEKGDAIAKELGIERYIMFPMLLYELTYNIQSAFLVGPPLLPRDDYYSRRYHDPRYTPFRAWRFLPASDPLDYRLLAALSIPQARLRSAPPASMISELVASLWPADYLHVEMSTSDEDSLDALMDRNGGS